MNRMRKRRIFTAALAALLLVTFVVATTLASADESELTNENETAPTFYLGVTFGGNTTAEAKLLIDRVKSYTNVFVVQSGPASKNETSMDEIVDYAVGKGLNVIVYFGWLDPAYPWRLPWLESATQRWGKSFLGVYFDDEPSGVPLDYNWTGYFTTQKLRNSTRYQEHAPAIDRTLNGTYPHNHDEAAALSVSTIEQNLAPLKKQSLTIFTSDYVLYWFDYLGGYNVMLSQFGWNQSITQDIALLRGAARMQNKTWGAIITWKYDEPPYLDGGREIYSQLLTAYQAGAKYGVVFNYPQIEGNSYGTLTDDHFEALERFWNDVMLKPKTKPISYSAEAVLVLPRNYGWGMRRPDDRIWGYWGPDEKSAQIWEISRKLLSEYGLRLDIVYEDPRFPVVGKYSQIYYWNQTVASANQSNQPNLHFDQNHFAEAYSNCPTMAHTNSAPHM